MSDEQFKKLCELLRDIKVNLFTIAMILSVMLGSSCVK
jgi:hypothetical protein